MNLVRWFRKNNTKVMAVVVIVLMVGFIGGSSLTMLLRGSGGADDVIATFVGKGTMTPRSRQDAKSQLELLQVLGGPQLLLNADLPGLLLSELLFSGDRASTEAIDMARQAIQRYGYRISDKQLRDMYQARTVTTEVYWILLREESRAAGIHVSADQAGQVLGQILPQLSGGRTYQQVMNSLISRYGLKEAAIQSVFGDLLAVLQYTNIACSLEDLTTSQIKHKAQAEGEMLNAEMVPFKASYFVNKEAMPSDTELAEQFAKYNDSFDGDASEANPFGFGYKLPDRVQLEYVALKLQDVKGIVKAPTAEEAESFYRDNRTQVFTQNVPSDPNDPNSPTVPQVRPYAEVADDILDQLMLNKIMRKAEEVLLEVSSQANTELQASGSGDEKLSLDELKKQAGLHDKIAEDLSQRYGLELYSGRTGLLSAADVQAGKYLNRLSLKGHSERPVRLSQLMFSLEAFGDRAVTLMSASEPQMYRMIGPVQDPMAGGNPDVSKQIMAVVRIVAAEPAAAPESLDTTYSTKTLRIGDLTAEEEDNVFSVREKVVEDVKALAAWDTTKTRAQEFVQLAAKDGWDEATKQFNGLYGAQATSDPNDPNVFESQNQYGLRRLPAEQLELIATQRGNIPGSAALLRQLKVRGRFVDRLFAEAPANTPAPAQSPKVMEFKPQRTFYCIKSITLNPLNQQQFKDMKGQMLVRQSHIEAQSLAAVHLNPKNIVERMNFQWSPDVLKKDKDDAKEEETAEETSAEDAA